MKKSKYGGTIHLERGIANSNIYVYQMDYSFSLAYVFSLALSLIKNQFNGNIVDCFAHLTFRYTLENILVCLNSFE